MFSTENLQVGDKVIVICYGWGNNTEYIGEIVKKTPTGLVDVKYSLTGIHRFRKDGRDYSKQERHSMYSIRIEEYAEERAEIIRKRNKRANILKFIEKCEWDIYEDAELEQIYNFIKGLRST